MQASVLIPPFRSLPHDPLFPALQLQVLHGIHQPCCTEMKHNNVHITVPCII